MRGTEQQQSLMFQLHFGRAAGPKEDPLRAIRAMADAGLTALGATSMRFTPNSERPP